MLHHKTHIKLAAFIVAALLVSLALFSIAFTESDAGPAYHITNPYADVEWETYGQYKANLHTHSNISDGDHPLSEMVEAYYAKGYHVLAMTDHNHLSTRWDEAKKGAVSSERTAEILAGAGRGGAPMVGVDHTNEHSSANHINTFWHPNSHGGNTISSIIEQAESYGGVSHINHPGRYTGGSDQNDSASIAAAKKPKTIKKYVDLFTQYPSCVGMEIVNRLDNDSKSDRILWDSILTELTPGGRPVWGFAGDDAHRLVDIGYAWNVLLMPSNNQADIRKAIETGAFYAVSRVSRLDGVNRKRPDGKGISATATNATLYLLEQPTPEITNIVVGGDAIRIDGLRYDTIEWIADGAVIATGNELVLTDYAEQINGYVRAQLKSQTGIAFTQPFMIRTVSEEE